MRREFAPAVGLARPRAACCGACLARLGRCQSPNIVPLMLGQLLWPGALFYSLYAYLPYAISAPVTWLLFVDVAVVTLSAFTLIGLLATIDASAVRDRLSRTPARWVGGALTVIGLLAYAGVGRQGGGRSRPCPRRRATVAPPGAGLPCRPRSAAGVGCGWRGVRDRGGHGQPRGRPAYGGADDRRPPGHQLLVAQIGVGIGHAGRLKTCPRT
jgi:hypothetical protein